MLENSQKASKKTKSLQKLAWKKKSQNSSKKLSEAPENLKKLKKI